MPQGLFDTLGLHDLADVVWDGIADATKDNADGALSICIRANGDATFRNMDAEHDFAMPSTDASPHDCAHDSLPPVALPQDAPNE